jgi:hypothetical protein
MKISGSDNLWRRSTLRLYTLKNLFNFLLIKLCIFVKQIKKSSKYENDKCTYT